jgi:putative endonuclease
VRDPRPAVGLRGEEIASRHLEDLGYRILARRYRSRHGELDLVADDGGTLVFVEVKTRRTRSCGPPEEGVSGAKQRRLARLAQGFISTRGLWGRDCRFDVVAVEVARGGGLEIRHLRDAFRV